MSFVMVTGRVEHVLADYSGFTAVRDIRLVAAGTGFSGAEVWRIEALAGAFALRAWHPRHPSPQRLHWIHAVLAHVDRQSHLSGVAVPLPLPLSTLTGKTWVEFDGRCWELAPWLPGVADEQSPLRCERLAAALKALARFHQAAADFSVPCPGCEFLGHLGVSPNIVERRQQLSRLMSQDWAAIAAVIQNDSTDWPSFRQLASRWLTLARRAAPSVAHRLVAIHHPPTPLQPCLRDIKRDHVLFTGDEVTGIVDFGAMRPESVSADVARLVGSYAADSAVSWPDAIAEYETIRPLSTYERWLIDVFDESGLLLGGANWVEWVIVQRRLFQDREAVESRLSKILSRLSTLAERR